MRSLTAIPVLLFSLLTFAHCGGEDWRQFRGTDSAGITIADGLPVNWTADSQFAFKVELPGKGASSPIVVDDQVVVTCYSGYGQDEDEPGDLSLLVRHVIAFDLATGDERWRASYPSPGDEHPYEGFQTEHGYASATPVSDGKQIFVSFGRGGVVALTIDGQKRWQTSIGNGTHPWGSSASPVLASDVVIINASVESESVIALNKATGDEVWRAEGIIESWSSPLLVRSSAKADATEAFELVVAQKGKLSALDPGTGESLWSAEFVNDYICPTPIANEGVVYAIGGRRSTAIAVRSGGKGDIAGLWEARAGANVGSPIYHDGHVYFVNGKRGMAYCLEAKTGKIVYQERLTPRTGTVHASPLLADGKLYFVTRDSGTFVIAAASEFELIAYNPPLDDSRFNASPIAIGNRLILRSDRYLYCFANSQR
jgi:outer membrane protein assembly factor BamB